MKRNVLTIILVLGAILAIAPVAQARLDETGGLVTAPAAASSVVLHTDVLGGDGTAAQPAGAFRPGIDDFGYGHTQNVPSANSLPTASGDDDSFSWGKTGVASLAALMLLVLASAAVTRRRHRLGF